MVLITSICKFLQINVDQNIQIEIAYLEERDDWGLLKGNRIPFFSDFAIRYNTDVPATPPTSANKMRRSGAIFSNPVGGGGGVGLITRITLKYLKFVLNIGNAFCYICMWL